MAAVSLSKNNNMAAVKSCENILHVLFPLLLVPKLDFPPSYFNWGLPKNCTAAPALRKNRPFCVFFWWERAAVHRLPPTIAWQWNMSSFEHCILLEDFCNCGRQEELAILIFRFLVRMRRMYVASIRTSTKNEWNARNAVWSRASRPSAPRNLITRVLTICHVKLTQSTAMEQKRLHLRWVVTRTA